jgi:cell division transport system permease protein
MSARADEGLAPRPAPGPLLPKGRLTGPMPWVIAIMMFLTVLASATGLALDAAARSLSAQVSNRFTVQIAQADAEKRDSAVRRIVTLLGQTDGVSGIEIVPDAALQAQLAPWLGSDLKIGDIPLPALVDADLAVPRTQRTARLAALDQAVRAIDASARVEPHARHLAPLARLVGAIGLLAFALVALMALATGAVVVLAARGAHATHRATIEIMHMLGATDAQVIDLFQRRLMLDAGFGAAVGFVAAAVIVLLLGEAMRAVTSDLVRGATLPASAWPLLLALPLAGVAVAWLSARLTLRSALKRSL